MGTVEILDGFPLTPSTKCGLPYGGCALCDPVQFAEAQALRDKIRQQKMLETRRRHQAGQLSHHLGDYNRACPPEFSKPVALRTARGMAERHGIRMALKKAKVYLLNQAPESWAEKHWAIVVRWIEAQSD